MTSALHARFTTLVICIRLRNSVYVLSKLILKLFQVFKIMFSILTVCSLQSGEFERFDGFCVDSY